MEWFLSETFNWKKAPPRRRTVKLGFPFFFNLSRYLYEQNCPNLISGEEE